ncbi:MAG: 6-bladed beta-propeller [Gemmatimonadaceae bacterium]
MSSPTRALAAFGLLAVEFVFMQGLDASRALAQPMQVAHKRYAAGSKPNGHWVLSAKPLLSIGGAADGAARLETITSVLILENRQVAVGLMSAAEIRVFDSTGRFVRQMGKKGRGPGEFPVLWQVYRARDSIVGVDQSGIAQIFDASGRFVRSAPRASAFGRRTEIAGFFSDGSILGHYYPDPLERAPIGESLINTMLVRAVGSSADSLFRVTVGSVFRPAVGQPTAVAFSARLQVATFGERFCLSTSERLAVSCDAKDGARVLDIEHPNSQGARITDKDKSRYFEGIDRTNPDPRAASYRNEVRRTTHFADVRPQIGRLVPSIANELWVGSFDPAETIPGTLNPSPEDSTRWRIYSATGQWLGALTLPPRFRLMDVARDWIAGVRRDEAGVERGEIFHVTRE